MLPDWAVGDVHRRLRNAVHVDQQGLLVAMSLKPGPKTLQLERFAAEDDVAQSERRSLCRVGPTALLGLHQLTKSRWRLIEHRHAFVE